jgi:hypothetical protein
LQPYPVVAAYALLEIGTAAISAVLSLDSISHTQTLPVFRNVVTAECIVTLLCTALSGYAFLNVSRTAADYFYAK